MSYNGNVIARPGQTVDSTAAEAAGVDPAGELARLWREQLEAIARAEREADKDSESIRIR